MSSRGPLDRITRRELLKYGLVVAGAAVVAAAGQSCRQPSGPTPASTAIPKSGLGLPWAEANQIVAETVIPAFPDTPFIVTDARYGAVGDGTMDNTDSFRRAIEDCNGRGGGRVVVPSGVYSTGAIRLLSNVDLHLEPGCVLRFNGRVENYPLVLTRYEGIECMNHSPMVYALDQTNIALTGSGTLDAAGTRTWNAGSNRAGILEPMVAGGLPPDQRIVPEHGQLRSTFVEPYRCTNVLIEGVTLRQSQFWQLHPTLCRNVTVDGVTTGDTTNPNSDGCNPESCDHVVIKSCTFSADDDCIAIKSGRDADGRRVGTPAQNIVILACRLQGSAGGLAFGSEMTGGIRNVYAYDIRSYGKSVHHMLYVKSNTRRGGYAQNIHLDRVQGDHLQGAWAFAQMDYNGQTGSWRPAFKDWFVSNSSGDSDPLVFQLSGLVGDPISGLNVRDSRFTHITLPIDLYNQVEGKRFDNVTINGRLVSS